MMTRNENVRRHNQDVGDWRWDQVWDDISNRDDIIKNPMWKKRFMRWDDMIWHYMIWNEIIRYDMRLNDTIWDYMIWEKMMYDKWWYMKNVMKWKEKKIRLNIWWLGLGKQNNKSNKK